MAIVFSCNSKKYPSKGEEKMSDLVRATIIIDKEQPEQVLDAYNLLCSATEEFQLIRIKDKL